MKTGLASDTGNIAIQSELKKAASMSLWNKVVCQYNFTIPQQRSTLKEDEIRKLAEYIDNGANIHCKDEVSGGSPIIMATTKGMTAVVKLLLSRGADVHDEDIKGHCSLSVASANNWIDIVELLLANGANIHRRSNQGSSAIWMASQEGNTDIVRLLLSKGAKVGNMSSDGFSCLMVACQNSRIQVVELLLSYGADLNCISKSFTC